MANFTIDNTIAEMIKNIDKLANDEEIYEEMINAGTEIMKKSISQRASKHIVTGQMVNSLKTTKPTKNKDGDWVGRVKFSGSSGIQTTKSGKKYDITNWLKAFRIEYGRSNQRAQPFVRPAIQSSEKQIQQKWEEIYDKRMSELK